MDKGTEQRIRNLLGMAQRARKLVSGNFAVDQSVKDGTAKLIILAEDAEDKTRRSYEELSKINNIPCYTALDKASMGACIGKEYRAVTALLDDGFSRSLSMLLGEKK